MTASFTTVALVGNRVMVKGTDLFGAEGQTVLDSSQWVEVNSHKEYDQAKEAFDAAVEEFFAPLQQAADRLDGVRKAKEAADPISYVVLSEAVEGVAAKPATLVKLTRDSIILRILESDSHTERLAWVGDDLEVLAAPEPSTAPAVDESEVLSQD